MSSRSGIPLTLQTTVPRGIRGKGAFPARDSPENARGAAKQRTIRLRMRFPRGIFRKLQKSGNAVPMRAGCAGFALCPLCCALPARDSRRMRFLRGKYPPNALPAREITVPRACTAGNWREIPMDSEDPAREAGSFCVALWWAPEAPGRIPGRP